MVGKCELGSVVVRVGLACFLAIFVISNGADAVDAVEAEEALGQLAKVRLATRAKADGDTKGQVDRRDTKATFVQYASEYKPVSPGHKRSNELPRFQDRD